MRASVAEAFVAFSAPLEGVCTWLYCDVLGLVTTAIGVLVDPVSAALSLPWVRPDGSPASHSEIVSAWSKVKARQDLKLRGGGAYRTLTDLRLTDDGVREVVAAKLAWFDRQLAARFAAWEEWPADAQLAALSMAWAVGPGWPAKFPRCAAACASGDFLAAAAESHIDDAGNPGVKPRNVANATLYRNASVVAGNHLDRDRLWWPRDLLNQMLDASDDTVDEEKTPVIFPIVHPIPDTVVPGDDDDPEAA